MARCIVIEEECEHGQEKSHYLPHEDHQGPHVLQNRYGPDCPHCPGGSRRVLDPGSFVDEVAHAVMCYSWTTDALADMESPMEGLDLAHLILDALAGGEQIADNPQP